LLLKKQASECAVLLGYDFSTNFFLKRVTTTLIIYDLIPTVQLVLIFEMDTLDTLFFNPNKYINSNESNIVTIIKKFIEKPK